MDELPRLLPTVTADGLRFGRTVRLDGGRVRRRMRFTIDGETVAEAAWLERLGAARDADQRRLWGAASARAAPSATAGEA